MAKKRVVILGAAGRDFHNFNMVLRGNKSYEVVAFTAAQIPNISGRKYPKELAGKGYPDGIPIYPENKLKELIVKNNVDKVVFAYSDISHIEVMHAASIALAAGADFWLLGPKSTMLKSKKLVVSVTAVRTGSGKSPVSRTITDILRRLRPELRIAVIRHPMPYGDLKKQIVQRFSSFGEMKEQKCTIEEMEEYLPHIERGNTVFAGVDYEKILKAAEKEADLIIFDGGNNDFSFIQPDLNIVVADARRAGHEVLYHPGETNLRMADVIVLNKINSASREESELVLNNIKDANPDAAIIKSDMLISIENHFDMRGKRILAIEDGPTLTHGGLTSGAASIAAQQAGAYTVNPRQYAVGSIKEIYEKYPHLGTVLPAMGYSQQQVQELQETINAVPCDAVLIGTPVDLRRVLTINKPAVRVRYELKTLGKPDLEDVIKEFLRTGGKK